MIADGLGLGWYAGLLVMFFVGTVVLANLPGPMFRVSEGWLTAREGGGWYESDRCLSRYLHDGTCGFWRELILHGILHLN